jgi:hypothetical protein
MNLGNIQLKTNGMVDREAIASIYGWSIKEIYRAKDAWRKLYDRQPASAITFSEYLEMMKNAGLRPDKVGLRRDQYQLARYNDSGAYVKGNCRFITQKENQSEKDNSYQSKPCFRQMARELALKRPRLLCVNCGDRFSPGMLARWHGGKCTRLLPNIEELAS